MSGFYLKLDHFEGPLDLLLHLIKVNEIDIFNIDIFFLTNQYLKYLRLLKYDDLSDAGEFVEMAASLIEMKSRLLLPTEEIDVEEELEKEDPRADLQSRLIEYEMIRGAAGWFQAHPEVGVDIQVSHEWQRLSPMYDHIEAPLKGDPASIVILFEQILQRFAERKPPARVEAITHRVSVEGITEKLSGLLDTVKFALFQAFYKDFESRYELVVHILAVLEMSRWGRAKIHQEELGGPIWVHHIDFDPKQLPGGNGPVPDIEGSLDA